MMHCKENSELYRIYTYSTWKSTVISPLSLARLGFFYSGKNDEVVCFSCKKHFDGWSASENPLERHRRFSPDCPFLNGRVPENVALKINHPQEEHMTSLLATTTDNGDLDTDRAVLGRHDMEDMTKLYYIALDRARKKGVLNNNSDLQLDQYLPDFDKLRHEDERLLTYRNWPSTAKANSAALARAGFFYTGSDDRVQCAFCRGFIHTWLPSDIPEVEHKKHFPECLFVRGLDVGNVPLVKNSGPAAVTTTNQSDSQNTMIRTLIKEGAPNWTERELQALGTAATPILSDVKYPDYVEVTQRIYSFKKGKVSPGQSAECLADAGWFFIGPGDKVLCFQCGGNLKDWEPDDDPWEQHLNWYPNCKYIRTHTKRSRTQIQQASQAASRVYLPEPREVKARMDTPKVLAILDMGYSRDLIKMAIENRLKTAGDDFPNAESLLEALFQLQEAGPQNTNYAADNLSTTSGYNSATSSSTVRSSQDPISNHRPDSASLAPLRPAFSAESAALFQSITPVASEKPAASAMVHVATENELVAEGQSKAKGKRKRNKKKKATLAALTGEDYKLVETPVENKNNHEKVEGDANFEDNPDEEAVKYQEENRQLRDRGPVRSAWIKKSTLSSCRVGIWSVAATARHSCGIVPYAGRL